MIVDAQGIAAGQHSIGHRICSNTVGTALIDQAFNCTTFEYLHTALWCTHIQTAIVAAKISGCAKIRKLFNHILCHSLHELEVIGFYFHNVAHLQVSQHSHSVAGHSKCVSGIRSRAGCIGQETVVDQHTHRLCHSAQHRELHSAAICAIDKSLHVSVVHIHCACFSQAVLCDIRSTNQHLSTICTGADTVSKSVSGLTGWVGNCSRVFKISFCSDQNCGTSWWVAGRSKSDITSACVKRVVNVGSLQHIVHQQCKTVDVVCSEQIFSQRECGGQRYRSVGNGHGQQCAA